MILPEIRQYVYERRQATLSDVALHFEASPDAVRGMLDYWVRKGKLSKLMASASCGTNCNRCAEASTEIYSWQGSRSVEVDIGSLTTDCTVRG